MSLPRFFLISGKIQKNEGLVIDFFKAHAQDWPLNPIFMQ